MMKRIFFVSKRFCAWAFFIAFVAFGSCYKESSENYTEEEIILENAAIGQYEADEALNIAYEAEVLQKIVAGAGFTLSECGITDDPVNKILTIHFDSACVRGIFPRKRQGSIQVNYSTSLIDSLSSRTLSFDNYRVNGRGVQGTVTLHDISFVDSVQVATRTLTDFSVSFPNGTAITFNGSHQRTWASGMADSIPNNNVYAFTGSMDGVSSSGRTFTQTIVTPVITNFYCASLDYFARTQGVVELTELQGYPNRKRTADYGIGVCNNTISIKTFRRTYGVGAN